MLEHGELKIPFALGPVSFLEDDREVKQGIRRNFARRAASYDRHAEMQRLMAQGLVAAAGKSLFEIPVFREQSFLSKPVFPRSVPLAGFPQLLILCR